MPPLSPQDLAHFHEHGYVILREAITRDAVKRTVDAIHDFVGGTSRETWYRPPHHYQGFMAMFHHQALWDNRQSPRIYEAFTQLHKRTDLWCTLDRVSMKLPRHPDYPHFSSETFLHWDCDPREPEGRFHAQGVIALSDCAANGGTFQCVPGLHKPERLKELCARMPADWRPGANDTTGLIKGTPVPVKAGDMIIWSVRLPHGHVPNDTNDVRYAQYLAYVPADYADPDHVKGRLNFYHDRGLSGGWAPDPRHWELLNAPLAQLSPLGRKLLGVDRW